jgi:cellulose synthase/poly-beta-1,6-N-acetylglucosamine synthase-like glycosyltransferase
MIHLILFLFVFLVLIYSFKILSFFWGLYRIKPGQNHNIYSVTIVVPARNEEENIAACLDSVVTQDYPADKFEIIVIDDNSKDNTENIIQTYCDRYPFVQLISLGICPTGISPKKRALEVGIKAASGEIILTTDADCIASPNWIQGIIRHYGDDVGMVAGLVAFPPQSENTLFHRIQSLEFIGLTTAGIGSIGINDPIIANGANLSFRKSAFDEVRGYQGNSHIISGDDDLLLQKIDQSTDWRIAAAISPDTIVHTKPVSDFNSFMNQRIRWASKSFIYKKISLVVFLVAVYLFYLLIFVSLPFSVRFFAIFPYPAIALFVKFFVDFLLILKGTAIVNRKDLRRYFLIADFAQIPYILYVGFASVVKTFEWKER